MVIPCVNPHSMNIGKRFWSTDNTDINRMFPGYCLGETTQRIADGVFSNVSDYEYGIQFASFYMQGSFIPHVRMMKTGFEDTELAKDFGLPYVYRRKAKPYDTTTLNYNWQIWGTKAFSIYTNATDSIDDDSASEAVNAVLNFLNKHDIVNVKNETAGFFIRRAGVNSRVRKGDILAEITDPYTGRILEEIKSPVNGIVFFHAGQPVIYSNTPLYRIIPTGVPSVPVR